MLLICLNGIQAYTQIDAKAAITEESASTLSFTDFLKTLPDSTATKINELQLSLAHIQDELDQHQSHLSAKLEETESDTNHQIDSDLENIGYLNQEMVLLTKALLNIQTSAEIEFELAYLEESKQLLISEVDKLSVRKKKKMANNEQKQDLILVNESDEDLDDYDFEVHPETKIKEYPEFECEILLSDTNSNRQTEYTKLSPFFVFTPKKLEDHFHESSFIHCKAQLAKTDKLYFINLEIEIQTKNARDTYGGIDKAAALRLQLINGDKLLAYNVKRDYGTLSADEESVFYNVIYSLDTDDIKSLSKFDLDKIGIIWSTGYEDYEVYQTDFIINHINCLNY